MMSKHREEAVWQRVMAASAEAPDCTPTVRSDDGLTQTKILELLERELLDACTYRTLAGRMGKQARCGLQQLAREEQQHYKKLEAIYYLMTGSRPCPDRPKAPCVACTSEELRNRYRQEVAGAEAYHGLAEKAGSFAELFHGLSRAEERHARQILALLQQCL